ncbi:MAG TPA: hypothetical protein VGP88_06050 [Thermoplasmata archaeon]|jgi:hypothetical protein|nr:hypothetical protein [Thermoplasmata archaeon]
MTGRSTLKLRPSTTTDDGELIRHYETVRGFLAKRDARIVGTSRLRGQAHPARRSKPERRSRPREPRRVRAGRLGR